MSAAPTIFDTLGHGSVVLGPPNEPTTIVDPAVHYLIGDDAYAQTQTDYEIADGDVIVIGDVIGIMVGAWPVALYGDAESVGFHTLTREADITALGQSPWGRRFEFKVDGEQERCVDYTPPATGANYLASGILCAQIHFARVHHAKRALIDMGDLIGCASILLGIPGIVGLLAFATRDYAPKG